MYKTDYERSLDQASILLIQTLTDKVKKLMSDGEQNGDILHELVKRTQQLAVEGRLLYGRCKETDSKDEAKARLWELGYRCEQEGSCVRIELPLLLPKRGTGASFITEPLHDMLSLEDSYKRFKDCTVVFRHIYGGEKKIADIRDHDNIESRAVLNVIERYFLTSDSGYYCTNIQTTELGRSSKTIIHLLSGRPDIHALRKAVTG